MCGGWARAGTAAPFWAGSQADQTCAAAPPVSAATPSAAAPVRDRGGACSFGACRPWRARAAAGAKLVFVVESASLDRETPVLLESEVA